MDELISTGKILFVIFFAIAALTGVVMVAKRYILAGSGLIALSWIMLLITFWIEEFDKLGWTPLWIFVGLLVLSIIAWFTAPYIDTTKFKSDDD